MTQSENDCGVASFVDRWILAVLSGLFQKWIWGCAASHKQPLRAVLVLSEAVLVLDGSRCRSFGRFRPHRTLEYEYE
jgi:hypothetical protein